VTGNPTLKVPLARMVDGGLTEGMVEWVTGHVLRHHLGMDTHIHGQDGVWRAGSAPPLARDRTVAVLGLGVLGTACAQALAALNFRVLGWSRSPKVHRRASRPPTGPTASTPPYGRPQIVVLLLPDTPATENTLNARTLVAPAPGRGHREPRARAAHRRRRASRRARQRADRPRHARRLPDRAPAARASLLGASQGHGDAPHRVRNPRPSAARVIVENIRRGEAGEPFLHLVDRAAGY
jgi:glyoxylate/hydroxypyruvate reductase A